VDKSPAFQFYPAKWESHTGHLSDYAYRIYHRIICWMWQQADDKCSISADDAAIAILLAQPCERIASAMREINNEHMPLLKKRNNKLISGGLEKEAKKQKERRKKAQDSANARWGKSLGGKKKEKKRNANASSKQCSSSSTSSSTLVDTPLPPVEGDLIKKAMGSYSRLTVPQKKRKKVKHNTELMVRVGRLKNRGSDTLWNIYEAEALLEIHIVEDELRLLEVFYGAHINKDRDTRRHSLETLMNNWNGEVDKARDYKPSVRMPLKKNISEPDWWEKQYEFWLGDRPIKLWNELNEMEQGELAGRCKKYGNKDPRK